jgi:hypothetical protein
VSTGENGVLGGGGIDVIASGQGAARPHPLGRSHRARRHKSPDGRHLRHYVDGVEELSASDVVFTPLASGQTSFGARQNKVSWYKDLIREMRVHPAALAAKDLQRGTNHED